MTRSLQTKQQEKPVQAGTIVNKRITILTCTKCGQKRVLASDVKSYFDEIKMGIKAIPFYVDQEDVCGICVSRERLKAEIAIEQSLLDGVNELVVGA